MGKATVVKVDGTEQALDHRPTLAEAQQIVDGHIEFIRLPGRLTLVVNEDAKPLGLPYNGRASSYYRFGYILGNAILLEGWRTVG